MFDASLTAGDATGPEVGPPQGLPSPEEGSGRWWCSCQSPEMRPTGRVNAVRVTDRAEVTAKGGPQRFRGWNSHVARCEVFEAPDGFSRHPDMAGRAVT